MRFEDDAAQRHGTEEPRPAGPVGAGDPPHPPVAKASSGVGPPTPPPAGGADQADAEGQAVEADLKALLDEAEQKRDEYLDIARRTQADFENYRKRMAAEVQASGARGKAQMAAQVVPVLDDLERALQAAGLDPEGDAEDGLAHGVLLVFRGLRETLTKAGVEQVDPKGERFDPTQHEALSTMPVEGTEAGVVVEVMQKGYRLEDQLLRPARVVVSA
ncbi:MAG TPA: nucleotide exchange factor GrpE [Solirubrobacterales bacterium]|nr:nucleotide exchange factor GrpE [Solirubrobacterales bacterium]